MKESQKPGDPCIYKALSFLLVLTGLGLELHEIERLITGGNVDWLIVPATMAIVGACLAFRDANNVVKKS